MTGMNRLSPLIVRPPHPLATAAALPRRGACFGEPGAHGIADDAKLFFSTLCGGLVFFSTFLA